MIHKTAIVDKNAKISVNVEIGPYSVIGPDVEIGESTIIHSHVNLTGNTKIGKNVNIEILRNSVKKNIKFKVQELPIQKTAFFII